MDKTLQVQKILTKSNQVASIQIAYMAAVPETPFAVESGFLIKNDSDEPVELEVSLLNMAPNEFVTTSFEPGWNPEIVRAIKSGDVSNIKWGM